MPAIKLFNQIVSPFLLFVGTIASGQTFSIESLEGTKEEVVIHKDEAYCVDAFTVSCGRDTLYVLNSCLHEIKVSMLNENLAALTYNTCIYGLGNERREYLLIVCVREGKVYAPLHILSEHGIEPVLIEPDLVYKIRASISGCREKLNYRLKLSIDDQRWDTASQKQRRSHRTAKLKFFKEDLVFYNYRLQCDSLSIRYSLERNKAEISASGHGRGYWGPPAVIVDDKMYYYLDQKWFEQVANETFSFTAFKKKNLVSE